MNNLSLFDEDPIDSPLDLGPAIEPMTLRPYQEEAIEAVVSGYNRGCMQQVISLATGLGKCVSEDTIINLDGFREIGSIFPDLPADTFSPISGEVASWPNSALATQVYSNGTSSAISIKTKRGYELSGVPRHPILVASSMGSQWKALSDVAIGDFIALWRGPATWGSKIRILTPSFRKTNHEKVYPLPVEWNKDLAYISGVIVGDGSFSHSGYRICDNEILSEVIRIHQEQFSYTAKITYPPNRCQFVSINSSLLGRFWSDVGLSTKTAQYKHIPQSILDAPMEIVRAFIQGLFDTDGSALSNGYIEFSSKSEKLVRQIHVILLGFGIVSSRRPKIVNGTGKGNTYHILTIMGEQANLFYDRIGFRIIKKQERRSALKDFNTNTDTVPFAGDLIYNAWKAAGPHLTSDWNSPSLRSFRSSVSRGQKVSRHRINALFQDFPWLQHENTIADTVSSLANTDICWCPVSSIENVQSVRCFDLVVPETHSFIANGIVSHNTQIFSALIPRLSSPNPDRKQVIVLAHREELLEQAANRIKQMNPGLSVEIEQASRWASPDADVVVVSVQTLGREGSDRIKRFDPSMVKMVVADECHRSLSQGFLNVFEHFDCLREDSQVLLLGVTATPKRGDKLGLGNIYKEIIYHKGILEGINENWLCDIEAHLIQTDTNLDGVATRAGDFADDQLADAINNPERNQIILSAWKEFAEGKRDSTLVFCASVEHAKDVAQAFTDAGIDARYLHGGTPKEERRRVVQEFKNKKFPVLTNCSLFVEGTDIPGIDCILFAKPTKSQVVYTQAIGRGLRNSPGKENCLLLDVVDVARKHSLVTLPTLFGLPFNFQDNSEEKSFKKTFEQIEKMIDTNPRVAQAKSFTEAVKIVSEKIDILRIGEIEDLKGTSNLNWYQTGENNMTLRVPEEGHIKIEQDFLGKFEARMHNLKDEIKRVIGSFPSMQKAIAVADHYVRSNLQGSIPVLSTTLSWYRQPASDKQKAYMNQLGLRSGKDYKPDVCKGDANHLITIRKEQLDKWKGKAAFRSKLKHHDVKVGKL